jgi:hypothetical protein
VFDNSKIKEMICTVTFLYFVILNLIQDLYNQLLPLFPAKFWNNFILWMLNQVQHDKTALRIIFNKNISNYRTGIGEYKCIKI